ncbi:MAG TPA: RsmB/NOP family class I SAM-dependent RNA methyltransferase [Casimicrobiaceae bacterium]|nr:RsmB/NOP family class I SAM-dependent RNA methyltransferase [Casimicrobiaceae bacterium]
MNAAGASGRDVKPHHIAGLAAAIERVRVFDQPADATLRALFRDNRAMGQSDRAFIAEGAFAYLRRMRSLEALAQTRDARKLALAVAVRELGHSVRDLGNVTRAAEAQWLAEFKSRASTELLPAVAADLPDWLWKRLGDVYGDERRTSLARALLVPAPFDLRANVIKTTREAALAALRDDDIRVEPTRYAPFGLRVGGRPMLATHPWLADGRLEVQDEGSQLIAHLVAPRRTDLVIDFCAGAGGKTLALGALMRSLGRLYAFDIVDKRLANMKPRLARSGLSNVHPELIAHERDTRIKRLAGKADRVLVDAPCTGFGTLRRNPDLKWRHAESSIDELTAKQTSILAAAAKLVKPGGRLVYATCSILPEENDAIVSAFLASHNDFVEGNAAQDLARANIALDTGARLRLAPDTHGCDGFFAAVLERSKVS